MANEVQQPIQKKDDNPKQHLLHALEIHSESNFSGDIEFKKNNSGTSSIHISCEIQFSSRSGPPSTVAKKSSKKRKPNLEEAQQVSANISIKQFTMETGSIINFISSENEEKEAIFLFLQIESNSKLLATAN